jgi:hypothetical protein
LGGAFCRPVAQSVIIESTGDIMIRTQISFEESEYALAKKEAKSLGSSVDRSLTVAAL